MWPTETERSEFIEDFELENYKYMQTTLFTISHSPDTKVNERSIMSQE